MEFHLFYTVIWVTERTSDPWKIRASYQQTITSGTRSIWKMLGPFATASRFTLPFTRCRHCHTPPAHRCPQRRQRVTWNGPNKWRRKLRGNQATPKFTWAIKVVVMEGVSPMIAIFFFSGMPVMECCHVDHTSPDHTIVGLAPGWVDTDVSWLHQHQSPSARWYLGILEVSSSRLVVEPTHW